MLFLQRMIVKDKAKISNKLGSVQWRLAHFGKLVFESDEQEFSRKEVKSKTISWKRSVEERFEGEKCLSQSWMGGKRKRAECHLHGQGKGKRDKSTESGSVHGKE